MPENTLQEFYHNRLPKFSFGFFWLLDSIIASKTTAASRLSLVLTLVTHAYRERKVVKNLNHKSSIQKKQAFETPTKHVWERHYITRDDRKWR